MQGNCRRSAILAILAMVGLGLTTACIYPDGYWGHRGGGGHRGYERDNGGRDHGGDFRHQYRPG